MHRALTPASAADDHAFFALAFRLSIKPECESSACIAFAPARRERGVHNTLVKPARCGRRRVWLAEPESNWRRSPLAFTLRAVAGKRANLVPSAANN